LPITPDQLSATQIQALIDGFVLDDLGTALSIDDTTNTVDSSWTYTTSQDLNFLAEGETLTFSYTITATDDSGVTFTESSATKTVTITLIGQNDAPTITAEVNEANAAGEIDEVGNYSGTLVETLAPAPLSTSGSFAVGDVDTSDLVAASYTLEVSGNSSRSDSRAPSDAQLLAMLSLNPVSLIGAGETEKVLNWTFDSGNETFDYLEIDQELVLTYTVSVTDDDGTPLSDSKTVKITIVGTPDPVPEIGGVKPTLQNMLDSTGATEANTENNSFGENSIFGGDADPLTQEVTLLGMGISPTDVLVTSEGLEVGNSLTSLSPMAGLGSSGDGSSGTTVLTGPDVTAGGALQPGAIRVENAIPDQLIPAGAPDIYYQIPVDTFVHVSDGAKLTYLAALEDGSRLPDWLRFDEERGEFRGTPPEDFIGVLVIRVVALDEAGNQAVTLVRLVIGGASGNAGISPNATFSEQLLQADWVNQQVSLNDLFGKII
ncbi:MAG: hypothetical protein HWE12_06395, partial [Oceanospirillaceae bacterium]|nr:hypothetical protein [Oceanospirillaceae bacterium]